jgi:hypothetical protein
MNIHYRLRKSDDATASISTFDDFGRQTEIVERDGLTYLVNEYWTSRQRQSSRLHEISYRACFKAELPRFFIERLTAPGDLVYDPFMGRGTTPLEAALLGRRPAGNDINPLSAMLLQPRLDPPTLDDVAALLAKIDLDANAEADPELLAFYHPKTLRQISALRAWLLDQGSGLDRAGRWIRMIALNRLTGHSPGFFSVYTLPPNQAVSVQSQRRINERRAQTPPLRDVAQIILRKSRLLLADAPEKSAASAILTTGSASDTPALTGASVALAVTSPPFLDIVDYAADNWLRCWFAGIDPASVRIDKHRSVEQWTAFVRSTLTELCRVVRPGGHIAFEVGEVRNGKVLLEKHVAEAAQSLPLELLGVLINQQQFTKTANVWGVGNNARGTNTNRICLFRRQ